MLKAGDNVTTDLAMGGHRVTGYPTGASASESGAVSVTQVLKVVIDTTATLNTVPMEPFNVTDKQYLEAVIAAVRHHVNNLKILNYSCHISPLSKNSSETGFVASAL